MANAIVTDLPIVGYFDRQRFRQYGPSDCANWYIQNVVLGKKKAAMYPTFGRHHVNFLGQNRLIYASEPRLIDKSVNYTYTVVGDRIFRTDLFFNEIEITAGQKLTTLNGDMFFKYIVVSAGGSTGSMPGITFGCFTDGQNMYLYREETGEFGIVTDSKLPVNPWAMANFGNRITVSTQNSATFGLSEINLNYNANFATMLGDCFDVAGAAVFAQEEGIIRQMAVLQNVLYIFTDFTTGIWFNIPSTFFAIGGTQTNFPWKKNTTYSFDYGISAANANTLDVDFGMMAWVGQNRNGLVQPMISNGGRPKPISTKAVDVLLQRRANAEKNNPFATGESDGFLFDYENTIFYRLSAGPYTGTQLLDQISTSNSIEYNFDTESWHRVIEANGERCRVQKHVFFGNRHLVTVVGDNTVYEMSGQYYSNEIENPDQSDRQAVDAYLQLPFRYERVTNNIYAGMIEGLNPPGFYAEFKTNYVEIDFVWGDDTFIFSNGPFANTVFIIDEDADGSGNPVYVTDEAGNFLIDEQGNTPDANSPIYYNWFKPNIELLFSNDGGISFQSAGQLEFSQIGVYQWRMRWYQLGCSRNRVYKLVCVSPAPMVILGGCMEVENVSGGAA